MPDIKELKSIQVQSGLAQDRDGKYRAFLTVRAISMDGDVLMGQLDPGEVRKMALDFLGSAEAADQDRIVMIMLTRDAKLSPGIAANFISGMREERDGNEGPKTPLNTQMPEEVSADEFIRQLKMAPEWNLWMDDVSMRVILQVRENGEERRYIGPNPATTATEIEYAHFLKRVEETTHDLPYQGNKFHGDIPGPWK